MAKDEPEFRKALALLTKAQRLGRTRGAQEGRAKQACMRTRAVEILLKLGVVPAPGQDLLEAARAALSAVTKETAGERIEQWKALSLIHISEPTRLALI
eukprot:2538808-Alexandrium_andersonii.AAC.1